MEKNIIVRQISNPGLSFTENINDKIILMSEVVFQNQTQKMSYQQFQQYIIDRDVFSGSYIRSFIPFLYNLGLINNYSEISFSNFFTKLGLSYIEIIKTIKKINFSNEELSDTKNYLNTIKSDIIVLGLLNMRNSTFEYFDKYCDILQFLKKYNTINREEFNILQFCKQNSLNDYEYINGYRTNPENFKISILDNRNEIVDYRTNNAYNYFIALLSEEQCNFVNKVNQNNYKLNYDRISLIDSILAERESMEGENHE